jgi:hypothetical protein
MIEVRVLQIEPHPDQATNNPGSWAVQYEVRYDRTKRTFWRWYTERKSDQKPKANDIIKRFWDDTFAELHGFSFNKADL